MNGSIRRQILIPIVAIQTATIAAITAAGVGLAASRNERQSVARLATVIDVLERSTFPLTSQVLERMHGLSEAHFVVKDAAGRTFSASDEGLAAQAPDARAVPDFRPPDFASWRQWPTLKVDGRTYYAAKIPAPASSAGGGATLLVLYPESSWRAALWDVAAAPVGLGLAAIALSAQAARWFADRIGRRVHRLRGQVARIADGDFAEIEPGEGRDEIADLIQSVNQMSRQLRDMRRAAAQAERTQLLAQLAAGFAHQLRNTLTGARLGVQLHAKRCGATGNDTSLGVAVRQLELAEEQVRGLLTLGRLEQRPHGPCDVAGLVRDVASLLEPTSRHARVALEVDAPDRPAVADVDESSLRAAVLNLGWNALDAAGAGGRVRFQLIAAADTMVIEVADDGPGPPADLAAAIFDPFVTGKPEGVGLGLALARRVAEAHRGTLGWRRDEGWTRFRLTLPREAPDTPQAGSVDESGPDRG
ncbi:sensor histidine kinase [Paludisphaera mucosa]|uniref:Signal transduction histidine-protein kinase/phosphatase MprB n=1 Tax=Paludisphaera mucosa TaxID=3030827 RepID=A0ABT6FDW3_9BACT|nr:HAMP domain-containing sensor histidine kinase [Paludisphaera mucosa]MDG3005769.1 HAMP domain-containing sensor histidine kinase [Paludisphaera mucosa]